MSAIVRLLWFLFIGWWLGALWFLLSLALMVSIIFLPVGAYTMSKTWQIMTLKRKPQKVIVEAKEQ